MSRNFIVAAILLGSGIIAAGCGAGSSQPVPTAKDFERKPPPPQWRGPGEPGGPASGPVPGPPTSKK